jgi:hypothetical protein
MLEIMLAGLDICANRYFHFSENTAGIGYMPMRKPHINPKPRIPFAALASLRLCVEIAFP